MQLKPELSRHFSIKQVNVLGQWTDSQKDFIASEVNGFLFIARLQLNLKRIEIKVG